MTSEPSSRTCTIDEVSSQNPIFTLAYRTPIPTQDPSYLMSGIGRRPVYSEEVSKKRSGRATTASNRSVRGREEKRGYFRSEEEKRREVILFHNFTSKQVKPLFVTYFPLIFSLIFCAHFSLGWLTVNCGRAGSAASKPHIFNSPALSASAT